MKSTNWCSAIAVVALLAGQVVLARPKTAETWSGFLARFPTITLPFTIEKTRWERERKNSSGALAENLVRIYLNQDPSHASFHAVGRLEIMGVDEALTGLIVRYEGGEDGHNDIYYLLAFSANGRLRATVELATFNGGLLYENTSTTTISGQPFLIRREVVNRAREEIQAEEVTTVTVTCVDFMWSGLPRSYLCE